MVLGFRVKYEKIVNNSDYTVDLIVWLLQIYLGLGMNLKLFSLYNRIIEFAGPVESQFGLMRGPTQQDGPRPLI